jgi:magnesium-transporting ATPase (P-type)
MPADNCIAFGDGTNDIEMLTWAGVGVSIRDANSGGPGGVPGPLGLAIA